MSDDKKTNGIPTTNPLVSILIPCVGMLEYTKLCVPSLLRHSRQPFELIFIDIGSLDGTAEYLAGLAAGSSVRIEVVRTPTDVGIREACKEAFARARGEYLVLLNNDTVVVEGWLQQLVALASMAPEVGLAGPMSNYAAPPQLVETVPYRLGQKKMPRLQEALAGASGWGGALAGPAGSAGSLAYAAGSEVGLDTRAVNRFAGEFREQFKGQWQAVERLGGFCLLIKREVHKRIGHTLEEHTDLGLFDTDILSLRARQAGFQLALCRDLFIHHFGTRTFAHGSGEG